MGADQFDVKYAQDKKEAGQFFSYFYWSINLGALCAYTLIAYICQYGLPFAGGERWVLSCRVTSCQQNSLPCRAKNDDCFIVIIALQLGVLHRLLYPHRHGQFSLWLLWHNR